jgi:DNA-binding GntR family transcriptional regulator
MSGLPELQRPETLTAATARHIGDAIVNGTYAPGTALPETSLARDIGVSKGTVREALRLLADDGLVEIVPHRGACVAPLTVRNVRETFGLRALLESAAARKAVESGRVGPALQALEDAYGEVGRALREGSVARYVEADRAFHESISRLSDDSMLLEMLGTIRPRIRRFIHWGRANVPPADWANHADIMAALRASDPDAVADAVSSHIVRAGELLVDAFEAPGSAVQPSTNGRTRVSG